MPSFYSEIASNKIKSVFLILIFVIIVVFLGWIFGEIYAYGFGAFGISIAFILSLLMAVGSYYYSDKIVLGISRARPLSRSKYPFLWHSLEGLSIAAGISVVPKAYVIDDSAPNAFATGRNPKNAVVCVTTGLLEKLDRRELEGVIAHELSHVKNYDILVMTIAVVLAGVVALISDIMLRSFFYGRGNDNRDKAGIILIVIGIVFAILAPIAATIIRLAISRKREFLADATGAMLTRYPEGLASALEKISKDKEPLEAANKATEHLYIINPLKNYKGFLNGLFSTHPPTEERIKKLRAM